MTKLQYAIHNESDQSGHTITAYRVLCDFVISQRFSFKNQLWNAFICIVEFYSFSNSVHNPIL